MKNYLFILVIPVLFFSFGCQDETQFEIDRQLIRDYLEENNLEATPTTSGLYYNIERPGGEVRPNINSRVEIAYRGMLLDGFVFDETPEDQTAVLPLANLIAGWQIGIPLIGRGGKIHLYVPSQLGYRGNQVGDIPPNSVLIFEVELEDFE